MLSILQALTSILKKKSFSKLGFLPGTSVIPECFGRNTKFDYQKNNDLSQALINFEELVSIVSGMQGND